MPARPAVAVAALVALAGCSSASDGGQPLDRPLTSLPTCGPAPSAVDVDRPEGLVLPDQAVLTGTTSSGPLTQVRGYAPLTPVQVRLFYERVGGEVQIVQVEDEVFEAELLVTDGETRTYVKALAVCDAGSSLDVLVAPESAAAAVPVPSGSASPRG